MAELKRQGVYPLFQNYLDSFLKARHCDLLNEVKCGVPQGDPLSMMLFCLATDRVLKEIAAHFDCVSYADDVVIDIRGGMREYDIAL